MPAQHAPAPQRNAGRTVATAAVGVLAVLAAVVFFAEKWLFSTWASMSVDELFYHLRVSLEGTGANMVTSAIVHAVLPLVAVLAVAFGVLWALRKSRTGYRVALGAVLAASLAGLGVAAYDIDQNMGLGAYVADAVSPSNEDFIEQAYVDPATVDIAFPATKRNLIYIFCESLEITYADEPSGGAFPRNVIPELTALAQANENFGGESKLLDGGYALPGTDWTMGGMFAQTSGLPLKLPLGGNSLEFADDFFPGITTLGDILAAQGYQQVLMIGSDASFGGRRLYFTQHGSYQIDDLLKAREDGFVPAGYLASGWGFEDERLFEWARQKLPQLAASGQPFNLTLLTLDTHFPDGWVCRLCDDEFGDNQYANVFACSSRQIAAFVQWVQQQDFYDNTTIVINGDHGTMDADFCDAVAPGYQRRTYTCVVNAPVQPADQSRTRTYSTFDMLPTTLAALGARIEGDALGLGVNLYGSRDTLVEQLGLAALRQKLQRHSDFLDAFSGETIDETDLANMVDAVKLKAVRLDNGTLEFSAWLSSVVSFEQVKALRVAVTDTRTGEEAFYDMVVTPSENDPNAFPATVRTGYAFDELEHLEATLLLSVEGFDDYAIATYQHEE